LEISIAVDRAIRGEAGGQKPYLKTKEINICICICICGEVMASRNIAITEDLYVQLSKKKVGNESFTKVIFRLLHDNEKPSKYFGSWGLTDEEENEIKKAKKELRQLWTDRKHT